MEIEKIFFIYKAKFQTETMIAGRYQSETFEKGLKDFMFEYNLSLNDFSILFETSNDKGI